MLRKSVVKFTTIYNIEGEKMDREGLTKSITNKLNDFWKYATLQPIISFGKQAFFIHVTEYYSSSEYARRVAILKKHTPKDNYCGTEPSVQGSKNIIITTSDSELSNLDNALTAAIDELNTPNPSPVPSYAASSASGSSQRASSSQSSYHGNSSSAASSSSSSSSRADDAKTKALEARVKELEERERAKDIEIAALREKVRAHEYESNHLKAQERVKNTEITTLKNKCNKLESDLEDIRFENTTLAAVQKNLRDDNDRLNGEIKELRAAENPLGRINTSASLGYFQRPGASNRGRS